MWVTGAFTELCIRCGQAVGSLLSMGCPWLMHGGVPVIHKSTSLIFINEEGDRGRFSVSFKKSSKINDFREETENRPLSPPLSPSPKIKSRLALYESGNFI